MAAIDVVKVLKALGYRLELDTPSSRALELNGGRIGSGTTAGSAASATGASLAAEDSDEESADAVDRALASLPSVHSGLASSERVKVGVVVASPSPLGKKKKKAHGFAIIDTHSVELPLSFNPMIELMAKNSHEVWAQGKVQQGCAYAPARNIKKGDTKLNPKLLPHMCPDY